MFNMSKNSINLWFPDALFWIVNANKERSFKKYKKWNIFSSLRLPQSYDITLTQIFRRVNNLRPQEERGLVFVSLFKIRSFIYIFFSSWTPAYLPKLTWENCCIVPILQKYTILFVVQKVWWEQHCDLWE